MNNRSAAFISEFMRCGEHLKSFSVNNNICCANLQSSKKELSSFRPKIEVETRNWAGENRHNFRLEMGSLRMKKNIGEMDISVSVARLLGR